MVEQGCEPRLPAARVCTPNLSTSQARHRKLTAAPCWDGVTLPGVTCTWDLGFSWGGSSWVQALGSLWASA